MSKYTNQINCCRRTIIQWLLSIIVTCMIPSLNEQFRFGNGGGGVEPTALINTTGTVFPIIVCLYNVF